MINIVWRFLPVIVVLVAFALAHFKLLHIIDAELLRVLPYILACILLGYASMFNRSRFIAPVVIALFAYHFIRERLQIPLSQGTAMAVFSGLNVLFCVQLMLSSLLPEKGLFNRIGCTYIALVMAGAGVLWFYGASPVWETWLQSLESQRHVFFEDQYWITQAFVILHSVTLCMIGLIALIRRSVADIAIVLTWLSGVLVFLDFSLLDVSAACFSALFLALFLLYQQSNYQVTYKDALTGISGRRALDDYLSTLGKRYAIAMLDVDHFKKFNDTYGHDIGDQVLKMVASKVAQVQGGGQAFRYGGEEFTIVYNRKSADDIFVFLEAVRESIQNYKMVLRSDERVKNKKAGKASRGSTKDSSAQTVSVTISIGLANSAPQMSPKDIIKAADQLLYKAKEAGRNCTIKESTKES